MQPLIKINNEDLIIQKSYNYREKRKTDLWAQKDIKQQMRRGWMRWFVRREKYILILTKNAGGIWELSNLELRAQFFLKMDQAKYILSKLL